MNPTRNVAAPRGMRARHRHSRPWIRWAALVASLAFNGCSAYGFGPHVTIIAFQLKETGVDYGPGDIDEKRAGSIPLHP
jgi:hypothetical protein